MRKCLTAGDGGRALLITCKEFVKNVNKNLTELSFSIDILPEAV